MDDMEIVRYKFTCCACYKTFVAKSGGGTRYVHCPYCGEENKINTGEHAQYVHKAPAQQPEKEPTYPTDPIDRISFWRRGNAPDEVKKAKKSSFQVGDDVILDLECRRSCSDEPIQIAKVPAKLIKYDLHGTSLFKGPHYELVFQPVTDDPRIIVEKRLQKNGDSYEETSIRRENGSNDYNCTYERVAIYKYHPAQYPKACRDAITYNNTCNDY